MARGGAFAKVRRWLKTLLCLVLEAGKTLSAVLLMHDSLVTAGFSPVSIWKQDREQFLPVIYLVILLKLTVHL